MRAAEPGRVAANCVNPTFGKFDGLTDVHIGPPGVWGEGSRRAGVEPLTRPSAVGLQCDMLADQVYRILTLEHFDGGPGVGGIVFVIGCARVPREGIIGPIEKALDL